MAKKLPRSSKVKVKPFNKLPLEEQIRQVEEALTMSVFPMLGSHGGGMEIMDIQGFEVSIRYLGACHGCALAGSGTLQFIEQTLQAQVDERIRVVPV
jgi:Fe-S cluster biogenesis protein NfuA